MNRDHISLSYVESKLSTDLEAALVLPRRSDEEKAHYKISLQSALQNLFDAKLDLKSTLNVLLETKSPILQCLMISEKKQSIDPKRLAEIVELYRLSGAHPFIVLERDFTIEYLMKRDRAALDSDFNDKMAILFKLLITNDHSSVIIKGGLPVFLEKLLEFHIYSKEEIAPKQESWLYKILPFLPVEIKVNTLKYIIKFQDDHPTFSSLRIKKIFEILTPSLHIPAFINCLKTGTVKKYSFINSQLILKQKTNYVTLMLIFAIELNIEALRDSILSLPYRDHINWGNYIYCYSGIYKSPKQMDLNIYPLSTYLLLEQSDFIGRYLDLLPAQVTEDFKQQYHNFNQLFQGQVPQKEINPCMENMELVTTFSPAFIDSLIGHPLQEQFLTKYQMFCQIFQSNPLLKSSFNDSKLEGLAEVKSSDIKPILSITYFRKSSDDFFEPLKAFPKNLTELLFGSNYDDFLEKEFPDFKFGKNTHVLTLRNSLFNVGKDPIAPVETPLSILLSLSGNRSRLDEFTLGDTPLVQFMSRSIAICKEFSLIMLKILKADQDLEGIDRNYLCMIIFEYFHSLCDFFDMILHKATSPSSSWPRLEVVKTSYLSTMPKIIIFNEAKPQDEIVKGSPGKIWGERVITFAK